MDYKDYKKQVTCPSSALCWGPLLLTVILFFNNILFLSTAVKAQDKTNAAKAQLEKLQTEIKKREASKQALEDQAKQALDEKQSLQQQMVSLGRKIQRAERRIIDLDDRIDALSKLSNEKKTALLGNKSSMIELMAALQRMGSRPAAASLLQPGEALDTARSAALLTTLLPHIDIKAKKLRQDLSVLSDLYKELSDKRFTLKHSLADLSQQNSILKNLVQKRESEEAEARAAARGESLRIARLVRSSKNTQDLLKKLAEESRRFQLKQARLQKEKERQLRQNTQQKIRRNMQRAETSSSQAAPADTIPAGVKFSRLKGLMPYPALGKLVKKYGQLDGISKSKGIKLLTRTGSQVVSPFEGRVVYAGPFRDYGQLVIIAHKEGYHGLIAGINDLYTALHQWVLLGEPLGQINGPTGRTAEVYFELRNDKGPINPLPWLQK